MGGKLRRVGIATGVALAVPLAIASASAQTPLTDAATPADLGARIDALLAASWPADQPGATVIVTRGGRTLYAGARGLADVASHRSLTADSVIRVGSITKQFTAAVILQLVEEGKVSLDDPIGKYVPGYPAPGAAATVRQLLNHTSGIQSYTGIPGWMVEANTGKPHTTAQMIATFRDMPMEFAPGARWNYNNSGYVLLGAIIEQVTGKPWFDAVQARITRPLGLDSIRYGGGAPGADWATPYADAGRPAQAIDMSVPHAAGALVGSVRDLAKWAQALHHGKVLKPASYALMIAPTRLNDGTSNPYGFGVANGSVRGLATIEHSGGIFGGNTDSLYIPSQDVFVAVFANSDRPAGSPGATMRRIAALAVGSPFPELTMRPVDMAAVAPMLGVYAIEGPDKAERRFFASGDQLYVQRGDGPRNAVFPIGGNRFAFGPRALEWFDIKPSAGGGYTMEMHQRGEDAFDRAVRSGPIPPDALALTLPRATLERYVGSYAFPMGNMTVAWGQGDTITTQIAGQPAFPLEATSETEFRLMGVDARLRLTGDTATILQGGREIAGTRVE